MAQTAPLAGHAASSLASNNPFRKRVPENTTLPLIKPSTNPFLDPHEIASPNGATKPTSVADGASTQSNLSDSTLDIFASLNIKDSPTSSSSPPPNGAARRENVAPRPQPRGPAPRHRPSTSDEERRRQQGKPREARGQTNELDIFADPPDVSRSREKRAPRRNSESSVRDKPKELDPEAEKRRRERRQREGRSSKSKKPNARLDIIDKLDVTSIYGTGLFHHDGPFDACNPHRNRRGVKQAPMHAFPKDSANMQLGGSGPVNPKLNLEQYHGIGQEAHVDYNEAKAVEEEPEYLRRPRTERSASFNPTLRVDPVHGAETAGLGTSTFLEGAPASRAAIQRREYEQEIEQQQTQATGLSRKKSLAQRIKSVRPRIPEGGRMISPEPAHNSTSPLGTGKSEQNAGNPFFKDYDREYEKKGVQIAFSEDQQKTGRDRATSSPRRFPPLERNISGESHEEVKSSSSGGGFLSRVKSIKGRSRTRERRNTEAS